MNFGWKWFRDPESSSFEWVDLPHSTTQLPLNNFSEAEFAFVSRYEKILPALAHQPGLRTWVHFEGVMARAEIAVDGVRVGEHLGGYTPFSYDLTDYLTPGRDNVLSVLVDGREDPRIPPFGHVVDYLTFAGIYREVQLEWVEPLHLSDTFIRPTNVLSTPKLEVDLTFAGPMIEAKTLDLELRLWRVEGGAVTAARSCRIELPATTAQQATVTVTLDPGQVSLWSPENPVLYELAIFGLNAKLSAGRSRFGFREARFTPEGFLLNGKPLKIRGLNRHQAWPHVGYAMPASAQARDADILKHELGVNLVRTSHYPQSRHFLDRCDELGLLVFEEIPGWQHIGDLEWQNRSLEDLRAMVVRDRNRACVILWGVRINESPDDDAFYRRTNALARELDPTRPTGGVRNFEKSALFEDVYTYNDFFHKGTNAALMDPRKVLPRQAPFLVTEHNGHMFPTKSFDTESRRIEHALRHARVLEAAYAHPQRSGAIGWCAFDYNTHRDFGSGDHICYHGVSDIFRIPKLAAAVYASQQSERPFVEVASALTPGDRDAALLPEILVFTNADAIRLSKNGEVIAEFLPDRAAWPHLPHPPVRVNDFIGDQLVRKEGFGNTQARRLKRLFRAIVDYGDKDLPWRFRILAAFLMATGVPMGRLISLFTTYVGQWGQASLVYTFEALKGGRVVATTQKGPSQSAGLEARPDSVELVEGATWDTTRIVLRHLDELGQVLTYSSEVVTVEVTGPGDLMGPPTFAMIGGVRAVWIRTRAGSLSSGERAPLTITIHGVQTGDQRLLLSVTKEKP